MSIFMKLYSESVPFYTLKAALHINVMQKVKSSGSGTNLGILKKDLSHQVGCVFSVMFNGQ